MKFPYKRINASTMDRRTHNSLRILGIIVTLILVVAACLFLGYIAFFIILIGGLSRRAHPQAANSVFAIILAMIALVTGGVAVIIQYGCIPASSAIPGACGHCRPSLP